MSSRPDPTLCTIDTFKALVQAAPGEVEALLKAGTIQRAAPGKVALIPAVRAFIEHTKAQARNATLVTAQEAAKSARAEASELSLQIERRELVADEDAQAALDHVAGAIITGTNTIPARATRDLRARSLIEGALRAALTAASEDLQRLSQ
jgi:hypothetical protein